MGKWRKGDDGDRIWDLLAGLALGAAGIAVLGELAKPQCPACKKRIQRGMPTCHHCYVKLEWK